MLFPMQIIFRMAVRNMLPEVINKAAQRAGRPLSAEEHWDIQLKRIEEATEIPSHRDGVTVLPNADPRYIESINRRPNGVAEIWLEDLDTDGVVDDESVAVEELLASGWEIDSTEGEETFPAIFRPYAMLKRAQGSAEPVSEKRPLAR